MVAPEWIVGPEAEDCQRRVRYVLRCCDEAGGDEAASERLGLESYFSDLEGGFRGID